ncbi:MAG: aspartate-semialdehyde dehydrogenase [Planctomycetota bacterium]
MTARAVAVVGATGAVGEELLALLASRRAPVRELRLFASAPCSGQRVAWGGDELTVRPLAPGCFAGVDLAFFAAGADVAAAHAPAAVAAGAVVVDCSTAFRRDPDVPLVVPEVNAAALRGHRGLIANPNCSTILLALALAPLHRAAGVRAAVVATYQAASGAGRAGIDELRAGIAALARGAPAPPAKALPQTLAGNLVPHVDAFGADGYSGEEDKLQEEARRILGLPELRVDATCVRVPVERCHSEAVAVQLARPLTPSAARAALAAAPGLAVVDEPAAARYPMPSAQSGRDAVAVGRIRVGRVFDPGVTLWLVGDQLRKGAALNAVQIAEAL